MEGVTLSINNIVVGFLFFCINAQSAFLILVKDIAITKHLLFI